MTQHVPPEVGYLPSPSRTANEAQYALPYVYSRQCKLSYFSGKVIIIFRAVTSTSTSLAVQNASPDHALAAVRCLLII
jgi:hypothetical protein